eukprot:gene48755-biopygen21663
MVITFSYALSSATAAFAGVLVAPLTLTGASMGSALGLKAFAVAIIGGLTSGMGAIVGGLILGVAETLTGFYISTGYKEVPGLLLLLLVLAIKPAGLFGKTAIKKVVRNPYYLHLAETILIYAILLFGLDIVVGYTGQVSLGHAGLFGIGSYTAGVLYFQLGLPFLITLPASIAVTALFGAILALPALRVTGPYLAMVTLAFGTIIQILINEMSFLTNGPMGVKLSKPMWGGN